ncbi:FadR/GntR family transcriptional regulator [Frankia sp. AgB32]|uniref:FadR/GntR family transcriptional regulator n=1 Tax=Frankia sp. AgB32 TaxID=631119 RepID=UPI00200C91DC|nr:FCD domain-containing protein [Frankia sp. AgB32]MCK9895948.1 FCD domain-containing protein [Frankia sp. AgB32]
MPRGTNLPSEAEMIENYRASRGSVREALRILEVQGLISIRPGPGGGPMLVGPRSTFLARTETLFFHLLQARYAHLLRGQAALEPLMARLAAANPERAQVRELEQFVTSSPADGDQDTYRDRAASFHTALIAASGNPVLGLVCQSIRDIALARIEHPVFNEPHERHTTMAAHAAIAQAVLLGDANLAERLMAAHMDAYCNRVTADRADLVEEIVGWH